MDFGSLAEGDNIIDQTNQKMDGLVSKCHELASLCKKGSVIGFGNSQQKIESIKQSIKGIGQSFKDILTDREVVSAAENLLTLWYLMPEELPGVWRVWVSLSLIT